MAPRMAYFMIYLKLNHTINYHVGSNSWLSQLNSHKRTHTSSEQYKCFYLLLHVPEASVESKSSEQNDLPGEMPEDYEGNLL